MCGYYVIDFFESVNDADSYYNFIFNKYGGSPDENEKVIKGSGIQEWLVSKLGDTELHLPVLTKKGIEKASFAGPNTNLEKRVKNLDVNITRSQTRKPADNFAMMSIYCFLYSSTTCTSLGVLMVLLLFFLGIQIWVGGKSLGS